MQRILTVCLGNICRSPTAEALLRRECPEVTVISAGLTAMVGMPADPTTQAVAKQYGLDLSSHRARQVTATLCHNSDLILVMEEMHKSELERLYPAVKGRVFLLGHFNKTEVVDPYCQPLAQYEDSYRVIAQGVGDWVSRIQKIRQG